MDSPESRILAYPHLPSDEQREVERFVDDHPEWTSLLHDVRALEALAQEVRRVRDVPPGDEVLATYAMAHLLYADTVPSTLRTSFEHIEARMDEDDALRDRYEDIEAHLEALDAAFDPHTHFERLTGHAAEAPAPATETDESTDPSTSTANEPSVSYGTAIDRVATWLFAGVGRRAVAALTVLVLTYAALFVGGRWTQDPLDRLASLDVDPAVLDNYQVRTRSAVPAPGSTSVDGLYLDALRTLTEARITTLGLFPRYDSDVLQRAETRLATVVQRAEDGSFLQLEALYYLGNVHLAQGNVDRGREALKVVVKQEGRRAGESYQILRQLQEEVAPR